MSGGQWIVHELASVEQDCSTDCNYWSENTLYSERSQRLALHKVEASLKPDSVWFWPHLPIFYLASALLSPLPSALLLPPLSPEFQEHSCATSTVHPSDEAFCFAAFGLVGCGVVSIRSSALSVNCTAPTPL